jgi:NAD(P)-dependent dehydrogenase (short-subunit alcohol dehydrogenase family)
LLGNVSLLLVPDIIRYVFPLVTELFSEFGREYNCTVNAVCPGPTNTHGFNHSGDDFRAQLQPLLDATPAGGRMGEPEEIAYAVGFLCEPSARWVTGVCMGVNGGYHLA